MPRGRVPAPPVTCGGVDDRRITRSNGIRFVLEGIGAYSWSVRNVPDPEVAVPCVTVSPRMAVHTERPYLVPRRRSWHYRGRHVDRRRTAASTQFGVDSRGPRAPVVVGVHPVHHCGQTCRGVGCRRCSRHTVREWARPLCADHHDWSYSPVAARTPSRHLDRDPVRRCSADLT